MIKYFIYSLPILFCCCQQQAQEEVAVSYRGSLKQLMHEGNLRPVVQLDTLSEPLVYGLGALDSLSGEFLILDGHTYQSTVDGKSEKVISSNQGLASLAVFAKVSKWQQVRFEGKDLEKVLFDFSDQTDLKSFPFIIKGKIPMVDYHIVNHRPGIDDISRHRQNAFRSSLKDEPILILGFFSMEHQGVFTHKDSNVHMHVITQDKQRMGHVDRLSIAGGEIELSVGRP